MTGADTANIFSFSKLPTSVPGDYVAFLTREAADYAVKPGPGGSVTVQLRGDSLSGSIAEEGLEFARAKTEVKTNDPKLDSPQLSGLGLWSMALATSVTAAVLNPPILEQKLFGQDVEISEGGENFAAALAYMQEARAALAEEEGVSEGTGLNAPPTLTLDPLQIWLTMLSQSLVQQNKTVSPEQELLSQKMRSLDPSQVQEGLICLAKLSPTQAEPLVPYFSKLAETISLANLVGGSTVLRSTFSLPITATLIKTIDMEDVPSEKKEDLAQALFNVGENLATANFEQLALDRPPSLEYQQFTSQDPSKLKSFLHSCISPLPPSIRETDADFVLELLSQNLALGDYVAEITSTIDPTAVTNKLKKIIEEELSRGTLSEEKAKIALALLPVLTESIVGIVEEKLLLDLRASEPATVKKALTILSRTDADPSPSSGIGIFVENYMTLLTRALAFLSQVRATIVMLEGTYEQDLSRYKLENISQQSDIASKRMEVCLTKINTSYSSTLEQIAHKDWMTTWMPIVAIAAGVLSLLIVAASIAITIVTAGAGSFTVGLAAVSAAQLIGFAIALATTGVALGLTVADAIVTWSSSGQKTMWGELAKACGITSPEGIAMFTAIVNIAILIITAIATLGIGLAATGIKGAVMGGKAAATAATIAKEGVEMGSMAASGAAEATATTGTATTSIARTAWTEVKDTVLQMISGASKASASTLGQQVTTCFVAAAFNGGGIVMGLQKLLKIMGANDETSTILASILSLIMMLAVIFLTSGAGIKTIAGVGKGVKTAAKGAISVAQDFVKAPIPKMLSMIENASTVARKAGEKILESLRSLAKSVSGLKERLVAVLEELSKAPPALLGAGQKIRGPAYWMFHNIGTKIGTALQDAAKIAATNVGEGLTNTIVGIFSLFPNKSFLAYASKGKLLGAFLELFTGPVILLAQTTQDALKIATSVEQIKSGLFQHDIQTQLGQLERDVAQINAVLDFFSNLKGIDPDALVHSLIESTRKATEQWNALVQLIDSFFISASKVVSRATAESAI